MSRVRVATLTASDTRSAADDEGGALLGERLLAAGCEVVSHRIVREDDASLREAFAALLADADVDAIVSTGGTGLAPRDRTIEVLAPLLDKTLDGFGEAFRRLSWDEVGARSILSRALAGTAAGKLVVALPGNPMAVRLAVDEVLAPIVRHAVALAQGHGHVHATKG